MEIQGVATNLSAEAPKFLLGEDGKAYDQPKPKWQAAPSSRHNDSQREDSGGPAKWQRVGDFPPQSLIAPSLPPPPTASLDSMSPKSSWPAGKGNVSTSPMPIATGIVNNFGTDALLPSGTSILPTGLAMSTFASTSPVEAPSKGFFPGDLPRLDIPVRPIFLAPATANIVPSSSKRTANKNAVAMQFIQSPREIQQQMLRDPAVAHAIMQTLSVSPQPQGGAVPPLLPSMLGGLPVSPQVPTPVLSSLALVPSGLTLPVPSPAPQGTSWSGIITLARNKGKRLPTRSVLLYGRVQDVEVVLRSAASTFGALDITHRVSFDEVAKRASSGSLLSMAPSSPAEQAQYEEYAKYFRTKMRAGVVKLDSQLSLYVLPSADDVPVLRDSVYTLSPATTPRSNCLLGLIASTTEQLRAGGGGGGAPIVPPPGSSAPTITPALEIKRENLESLPLPPRAKADEVSSTAAPEAENQDSKTAGEKDSDDDGADISQKEVLDLFSNPELIKLLSDDA